jgi:uncharacterized protein (TIGR00725 family)
VISVCGPNDATPAELEAASEIGRLIAEAGHALVCGGRGGVMEAACEGAKRAGGVTIGILPGYDTSIANKYVDYPIPTGLAHARNAIVAASGDAVIVIGGGFGTLSEIGLALKMGKRVVHIGSWELDSARMERVSGERGDYLDAQSPEDAIRLALDAIVKPAAGYG